MHRMVEKAHWRGSKLLRTWRERAGLNQQEAADTIGIDLSRYNAFENDRARPGLDWAVTIDKISEGSVPVASWADDTKVKRAS